MAIDIGRIAYEAYVSSLEEQECDCDLPRWEEQGKWEQDAWRAAAVAVLQYIDEEKERMEKDPDIVG